MFFLQLPVFAQHAEFIVLAHLQNNIIQVRIQPACFIVEGQKNGLWIVWSSGVWRWSRPRISTVQKAQPEH